MAMRRCIGNGYVVNLCLMWHYYFSMHFLVLFTRFSNFSVCAFFCPMFCLIRFLLVGHTEQRARGKGLWRHTLPSGRRELAFDINDGLARVDSFFGQQKTAGRKGHLGPARVGHNRGQSCVIVLVRL